MAKYKHDFKNGMRAVKDVLDDPDLLSDTTGLWQPSLTESFKKGAKVARDTAINAISDKLNKN